MLGATLVAGVAIALLVNAASVTDLFEIDQDATATNSLPGDDWDTLLANGNPNGAFVFDSDLINSSLDDNFTGGGSKDVRDVSSAGITTNFWQNTTATPPDKDDIEHAFAASYNALNGDLLIYFGADRFSNNGDSAIGFWFFQENVSDNNNSGVFTGKHKVGDILVTSDFRQGGGVGVINVFEWIGNAAGGPLKLLVTRSLANGQAVPDVFCNNAFNGFAANIVCATSNRSPKPVPGSWTDGYSFKGSGPVTSFPTGTFFEGGVNITALFPGQSLPCFASFLAMTRTSASTTAQLKDYVLGAFPLCGIEVGKACDTTNPPTINVNGTDIHYTFDVPIHNTGMSTVYNVKLIDDGLSNAANLDCEITAINATTGLHIALSSSTGVNVVSSLGPDATANVKVECNSTDNPMLNTVTATASTSQSPGGTLLSASHTTDVDAGETCSADVNPALTITKTCKLPVTINATTLKPHVCVDIVVTNTTTERLISGSIVDDVLGTLYGTGGSVATSFALNPGAVLTVPTQCYDTFVQDDDTNTLPGDVMFSDTATADARGAISGKLVSDLGPAPFATAHCPLCPHDE
jgi:hypothetical protein